MKILLVGETESIHVARWANQLEGTGWEVHLFQAGRGTVNRSLKHGVVHLPSHMEVPAGVSTSLPPKPLDYWAAHPGALAARVFRGRAVPYLAKVIQEIQPDVIHSLGLNLGWRNLCLTVLEARGVLGTAFSVPWIYSSYGQDLACYAQLSAARRSEVESVLPTCDYFISECKRDKRLADEMGFAGEFLGYLPAFGGVDLDQMAAWTQPGRPSARRALYLKGSDNSDGNGDPIGRAMTVMRALESCGDDLRGYRVAVGQTSPSISAEVPVVRAVTGLDLQLLDNLAMPGARPAHGSIVRVIGASRAMIAVTANDGLPSTLVEAMSVGALPIHSDLEPIAEWITDGENGLLVPPDDPAAVASAIKRAVSDDDLVDRAAEINAGLVREHLSMDVVRPKVIAMYEQVAGQGPTRPR